jgi:hypothetical protein
MLSSTAFKREFSTYHSRLPSRFHEYDQPEVPTKNSILITLVLWGEAKSCFGATKGSVKPTFQVNILYRFKSTSPEGLTAHKKNEARNLKRRTHIAARALLFQIKRKD